MAYLLLINAKEQEHFYDVTVSSLIDTTGVIINKMESGRVSVLKRWESTHWKLQLQHIRKDELVGFRKELLDSFYNDGRVTLDYTKMKMAGWEDFNETGVDPTFILGEKILISRHNGMDEYKITLDLEERVY